MDKDCAYLPNLRLPSRQNQVWHYSGIDSPEYPGCEQHFQTYPFEISYRYNDRGFRDSAWPPSLDELQQAIWCLGDSFTVGVGQSFQHIWPQVLQQKLNVRTINVSMDGASNSWIARTARNIAATVRPKHMIIMWSYLHRRELDDSNLDDEQRRCYTDPAADELDDWKNFADCRQQVQNLAPCMIQSAVPNFIPLNNRLKNNNNSIWSALQGPDWPADCPKTQKQLANLPAFVIDELTNFYNCYKDLSDNCFIGETIQDLIQIKQIDFARDGYHFDILTVRDFVDQILPKIEWCNRASSDFHPR